MKWGLGRPEALESGGHHLALACPQFLTPNKGSRGGVWGCVLYGRGDLWPRQQFVLLTAWPEPPREHLHSCRPQMGFPAGALGPILWPEPGVAPFPICARTSWGYFAAGNPHELQKMGAL